MTDIGKLPGTEITVYDKYPDSYRLDHPDFADVRKTTYTMGTITEFQQLQDDPIQVAPMVKVNVDGAESDYIPLFYRPKNGFWDGPDILAHDLDEETLAFKQAWQSFRVDDEVVVMLYQGTPIAILGFADGKPRIGENLIKFVIKDKDGNPNYLFIKCAADEDYNVAQVYSSGEEDPDGPDGLKLGINEEIITEETDDDPTVETFWYSVGSMEVGWDLYQAIDNPDYITQEFWDYYYYFYKKTKTTTNYHRKFTLTVGPIKYFITFIISHIVVEFSQTREYYYHIDYNGPLAGYDPIVPFPPGSGTEYYEDPANYLTDHGEAVGFISKDITCPDVPENWASTCYPHDEGTISPAPFAQNSDAYSILEDQDNPVKACQYDKGEEEAVVQGEFQNNLYFALMGQVQDEHAIQVFVRPHDYA